MVSFKTKIISRDTMWRIKPTEIANVLLFFLLLICVLFPADVLNIKEVVFVLLMIVVSREVLRGLTSHNYKYVTVMTTVFPIVVIAVSMVRAGNLGATISDSYVIFYLFLVIPIVEKKLRFENYFYFLVRIVAIITVGIVVLDILGIINVNASGWLRDTYYDLSLGYMGKSSMYAAYYKVFYKTSPLIIFLLNKGLDDKKYGDVVLSIMALIFSGTRANIFVMLGYLLVRFLILDVRKSKRNIVLMLVLLLVLVFGTSSLLEQIDKMMSVGGAVASDMVRSGQLRGFIEAFQNPSTLLFGDGFGSTFYNYGTGNWADEAELAYLSLLRQIGLISFVPFLIFAFYPIFTGINRNLKVAYLGYLAIAFTNPLFFSSTAYLVYIYVYVQVYRKEIYSM